MPVFAKKILLFLACAAGVGLALVIIDYFVGRPQQHGVVTAANVGLTEHRPGCEIKANVTRTGSRVYHVPGGQFYDSTEIDAERGERWFCSEDAAHEAGWDRSPR